MEFQGFPKIPRLSRDVVITEKIDGTNGQLIIEEDGNETVLLVGSRSRWITPEQDNHGFARWAYDNTDELIKELGPGRHYGEWWGQGINRGYGMKEKIFSLFNVSRWKDEPLKLCRVVPILWEGMMNTFSIDDTICRLIKSGSVAAPGFMQPEGIVIYHKAGNLLFKKTIKNDEGKETYGKKQDPKI
jgi:hypothetical protein